MRGRNNVNVWKSKNNDRTEISTHFPITANTRVFTGPRTYVDIVLYNSSLISSFRSTHFNNGERSITCTECPKKNVVSWKNSHNYLQTHPKCKIWGCFGKFRIFATRWALRFSKLKKKWLRKWSLKLPSPPPKIGRIHCSHYVLLWWTSAFPWLVM